MLRRLGAEPIVLHDGDEVEPWLEANGYLHPDDPSARPARGDPAVATLAPSVPGGAPAPAPAPRGLPGLDLVLSDIVMPGMDGETLCARLADRDLQVPVVAATGTAAPEALRRFPEAGFVGVLCKPYSSEQLGAVLLAVVNGTIATPAAVRRRVKAARADHTALL